MGARERQKGKGMACAWRDEQGGERPEPGHVWARGRERG